MTPGGALPACLINIHSAAGVSNSSTEPLTTRALPHRVRNETSNQMLIGHRQASVVLVAISGRSISTNAFSRSRTPERPRSRNESLIDLDQCATRWRNQSGLVGAVSNEHPSRRCFGMSDSHRPSAVVEASKPLVAERRRPDRRGSVSPALIPLLRGSNASLFEFRGTSGEILAPVKGIVTGVLISGLFSAAPYLDHMTRLLLMAVTPDGHR